MHPVLHPHLSLSRVAFIISALVALLLLTGTGTGSPPYIPNTDEFPPPGNDSTLTLSAIVSPTSAPIGAPFDFHATITNKGSETARFYVDGCPVYYVVDGLYFPIGGCITIAREIVLGPGQSITFGPVEEPQLHLDTHRFPLGPGEHHAELYIPGAAVGPAVVSFHVEAPNNDLAYLSGRVLRADGSLPLDFKIGLVSRNSNTGEIETQLGPEGYFLFDGVPPGHYYLRATNGQETWWYPGVEDAALAKPIDLGPGQYVGGADILIPGDPFPGQFSLSGQVFEATPESLDTPLADATVLAMPVNGAFPDDSTGVQPGDANGDGMPDPNGPYIAFTDPNGVFKFTLPQGLYRILAGKQSTHRYQYWNHVYAFGEAGQYLVPSRMAAPRFDLPVLTTLPAAIEGQVLGYNPLADAMPQPLEGATVVAMPALAVYTREIITTQTGPDGRFHLDISADTPYHVVTWADGYETMYFQNARDYSSATLVDVTPGGTTSNIDFALPEILPGHDTGSITGVVLKRLSDDCTGPDPTGANSDSCFVPAPGVLVKVTSAFPTLAEVEYQTYTDEHGGFRVEGLLADPNGYFAYYVAAQTENGELFYYPGGVSYQEAQPLSVYPGQVSDAGPIILYGKPWGGEGSIAGRVTGLNDQPIEHALVRVFVEPDFPWGSVAHTFSGPDGSFYVGGLPQGASVIVSAEASGHVPAYYPHAYRWTLAERVPVSGPNTRVAPLNIALRPAVTGGPFIQAGLVVLKPDSVVSDSGWVDPGPNSRKMAPASIRSRFGRLTYEIGVRDAFFYLVNADAMGPMELPVAGGSTGDNGASILRGLTEGTYIAYADRPGFERAYFAEDGNPELITLNNTTPAVLAWIELRFQDGGYVGPPGEVDATLVHNLTNVPNPFGPATAIRYTLRSSTPVTVQVFDQAGRLVRTIKRSEMQGGGPQEVAWDARDDSGKRVTTGVYFARILAGPEAFARKMVLLP